MTGLYVRSNVQSLVAANQINRNLGELSEIMTRLSTGLRINSGKDDPAGLIASELLKSDMTATTKAISNVQRANDMVAIADSALGQISSLLNDIKGLITEAASTGTMTDEQLYANQLQVNAALDSIDRIAKTSNYLGKLLLDGSLDFQTMGLDRTAVRDLSIYQANFGTSTKVDVGIQVIQDAAHAQLFYDKAGVSQDTVIEILGNDGSTLVKVAGGQSVKDIADAINLVSDSTGVRAVVGNEATAGQILITSAGLDNDINLTALMAGAAAGNYTVKFTAGDSEKISYTLTEPQGGKPGIIEFKLKMQPALAPSAIKFDESYNGIYTYDISGQMGVGTPPTGTDFDIVVQTNNGDQIRHIEFVRSAGPNASLPGGVAATYNKVTGKLQIQYDASGNVTEEALRRAINAIDGFEYMGLYKLDTGDTEKSKIPSVNVDQIGTTGMYLTHTDPNFNGGTINFTAGGSGHGVSVTTSIAGTLNVSVGALATYDEVIAALNASGSWSVTVPGIAAAPNSFKLVDAGGQPVKGTAVFDIALGTVANLSDVVNGSTMEQGRTSLDDGTFSSTAGVHLQTTHVNWNSTPPLTLGIVGGATGTNAVGVAMTAAGAITVTVGELATYADVLAALKNTSAWTGAGTPPSPSLGLSWTDAGGHPIGGTSTLNVWTDLDPTFTTGTIFGPVNLEQVRVSEATNALQEWLEASGSGTKAAIDLRANNALNITAAVPGTKFENTDIMYVKADGAAFTESFRLGYQNVYFTSDVAANKGIKINFATGSATSATLSGGVLNVFIAAGDNIGNVLTAMQGGLSDSTFRLVDPTGAPINMGQSAATLLGKTMYLDNVQMNYSDTAARAAATITLNNGAVKMHIVANTVGSQYNNVAIEFEQDDTFAPGDISVVYDEARKMLHIRGQIDGADAATYGALKKAIEAYSPFHVDITRTTDNTAYPLGTKLHDGLSTAGTGTSGLTENMPKHSAVIRTGLVVGDVGGNNQTLFITVSADATANDVVDAFRNAKGVSAQIAANFIVSNALDNTGTGTIFSSTLDRNIQVRSFIAALTGGNSGLETNVTAKELVNFINNDAVLSKLFMADVARHQVGNGFLTLFDEAAYYGNTVDGNALQFLGPKDSPDILFVVDGPYSQLGLSFVDNYGSGCISDNRPVASLNATNANAAFSVQALTGGSAYDDMVVRMIRLDNNHAVTDSYSSYVSGPSNAMAYCSINNDQTLDGTTHEKGKFIVYSNQQGDMFNNVDIVVQLDVHQTERAVARYDELTKRLIISVNSADVTGPTAVTLSDAVAAINNEGTFHAEYDYSFNTDPTDGTDSDGSGLETFGRLLSASGTVMTVIGNTGNTGGHKGGVLEVYVGGTAIEATANAVISAINNGPTVKGLFVASAIGGTDAGTGQISFRNDNIKRSLGADGKWRNEVNMVTGILGSDNNAKSYMVVHLASDANGNSITTAKDLVKFFDQLTAEQTRGISVSQVRPPGVDNLDRVWSYDSCGNLIETQLCDYPYDGILKPTMEIDDCGNVTYFPIEFFSYGEDLQPGHAYGSVIAQNGKDASLDIRAKIAGPDYNGVGFKYVKLGDPMADMYAEYDAADKKIVVYIQAGATAGQVKYAIENSEQTKHLFEVSLPGTGAGLVSLQDNYLLLKDGLYDAGYRGGAALLGAADADAHRLIIESMGEGSRQFVGVHWIAGGLFDVKGADGFTKDTAYGSDMIATINGMKARAVGRELSLESAMLKMGIILDGKVTTGDRINFSITGGGSVIQMGAQVVSNQQIRFGIKSINTANLGGASGRLYQLREGEAADLLTSDASRALADRIINEAIMYVSQTRGRLGSIQRNTLEPQIRALQDSLVATSAAEAQISNADFAEETSRLTRAQILVQAGTRTLQIANQFPQYAASLLGG